MLYPKNSTPVPDSALFESPTAEYRAAPFWAWNCDLDRDLLMREIGCMKEMGMGGFHMHVRTGMSTRYLSEEFMSHIAACADRAEKERMLAWLYDEDRWPSGFAGGFVTAKTENRQKYLLFTPEKQENPGKNERLLAVYTVLLDEEGSLLEYCRCDREEDAAGDGLWYAYLKLTVPGPWFHFNGYVDTMKPSAIRDFIRITHEKYREKVGERFGNICPAMFTDEPQMTRKTELKSSFAKQDIVLSFTDDFEETYRAAYGASFLDTLPEVIWERKEGVSAARYRYHDHATERFASAYSDQIGDWCEKNGLLMTGHMMDEGTLRSQTRSVGECMRSYRRFGLPGVDMLCDGREYNTVKQSASAAHQQGCPGVLSELYGVTNWDFDFRGHKLQGDWQAALGVSVRVPHLYWASMHGESKRDYPASIGHQSCWYRQYPYIEDHFARVNTLMTRGQALIRIGVIHPIESYWIKYGPADRTGAERRELDSRFQELTEGLLKNTLDFDFICESTLPSMHMETEHGFNVGEMSYDTVIVPNCLTLRSATVKALRAFREKGGRVIFTGYLPLYMDAVPSLEPRRLADECEILPWSLAGLAAALENEREISVTGEDGLPCSDVICGLRRDGDCRNVFICHSEKCDHRKTETRERKKILLKGRWNAELYDTLTGKISKADCRLTSRGTELDWVCWPQDSLLLRLSPAAEDLGNGTGAEYSVRGEYGIEMQEVLNFDGLDRAPVYLKEPNGISLHEENVCVLDMAEWRTDNGAWQKKEEVLRLNILAKKQLGLSTSVSAGAQPWILPPEKAEHTLSVRSVFLSDIDIGEAYLALEDPEDAVILVNGVQVPFADAGRYVDDAIRRVRIGPVAKGENTVEVTRPFTQASSTESMFILGAFGVRVTGGKVCLTALPETLAYGDWTCQGLPFYGGPLTYRYTLPEEYSGRHIRVRLTRFAAPCVTVSADGKACVNISLAPHETDLGTLSPGKHTLEITVWPSRVNTFGALHLNDHSVIWYGPRAWRTSGADWTYQYRLTETGLLSEPLVLEVKDV